MYTSVYIYIYIYDPSVRPQTVRFKKAWVEKSPRCSMTCTPMSLYCLFVCLFVSDAASPLQWYDKATWCWPPGLHPEQKTQATLTPVIRGSMYVHACTIFREQLISEGARFPVGNYLNYTNARSSPSWKIIRAVHTCILVRPGHIIIRHRPRGHSDYHHYHCQVIIITITRLYDAAPPNDRTPKQWLYEAHRTPAAGNGTSATACCQGDP